MQMSNFLNKVKDFLWTEEPEYDDDIIYDDYEEEKRPVLRVVPKKAKESSEEPAPVSNMIRIRGARSGVIDYRPRSMEDMASVARALRAGRAVVLHLDRIDFGLAQRALDFASGVIYACGCTGIRADERIYILVPKGSALNIRA